MNAPLLALFASVLAAHPSLETIQSKVGALLDEEWARTRRAETEGLTPWQSTRTPLLPGAWPPDGTAVTYAYGWRQELRGSPDHVSGLWGRVRIDAKGEPRFERLSETIDEVGLQERAPTCTKECGHEWAELRRRVESALLTQKTVAAFEATRARRHYENWAEWNAVSAWLAAQQEPAFFAWLQPTKPKTPPVGPVSPNTGELLPYWRLPPELRFHVGGPTICAQGAGPETRAWRVEVHLDTGRLAVSRAPAVGPFSEERLESQTDRTLPPGALKVLRGLATGVRQEKPPTTVATASEGETLLLGESWGATSRALWLSFGPGSKGPAAEKLIAELGKLAAN